tara:strand:+ start:1021 stop:1905 length:885 start_codon:yes stop_codon:yes gene_type:complete
MNNILTISGLNEIYKNYDVFILDQWGVMHDGKKGYPAAIECINKLIDEHKTLIIISNSSKRKASTIAKLNTLGFKSNDFIEVMTSGEMIWQSLFKTNYDEIKNLGKNCFHICDETNEEGKRYVDGLEKFNFVKDIEKADFVLGCTPFNKFKVIDFLPILEVAKKKNLLFICANPDFDTIEQNNQENIYCMGTIAEIYNNIGGRSFILGKPNINIYKEALKSLKKINKSKILAIGDSLYHDIRGAMNFEIDSLMITSTGIHHNFFDKKNPSWSAEKNILTNLNIKPTFLSSKFNF